MSKRIDEYLGELRRALGAADRATIQDALADAEASGILRSEAAPVGADAGFHRA